MLFTEGVFIFLGGEIDKIHVGHVEYHVYQLNSLFFFFFFFFFFFKYSLGPPMLGCLANIGPPASKSWAWDHSGKRPVQADGTGEFGTCFAGVWLICPFLFRKQDARKEIPCCSVLQVEDCGQSDSWDFHSHRMKLMEG